MRILLVDDERQALDAIGMLIWTNNEIQSLHKARTHDEALRILSNEGVDLIVIDIHLGTYSGFDLCRTVRRTMPRVYIAMCSGDVSEENRRLTQSLGAQSFLPKPIGIDDIRELVTAYNRWRTA